VSRALDLTLAARPEQQRGPLRPRPCRTDRVDVVGM